MPFSKRLQEIRQRRLEDMKKKRVEEKKQRKLERRLEAKLEEQQEEERRIQALLDYQQLQDELDAAQARRADFLARVRAQRRAENKAAAQKAGRQVQAIDLIRQAVLAARRGEQKTADQRARSNLEAAQEKKNTLQKDSARLLFREQVRREKRQELKLSIQLEERLTADRKEHQDEQKAAEQEQANRAETLAADRKERRDEQKAAETEQANRAETLAADRKVRRDEQKAAEQEQANRAETLAADRKERRDEQKAAEQEQANRAETFAADRKERRDDQKAAETEQANRAETLAADRKERRDDQKAAEQEQANRAEALAADRKERRAEDAAAAQQQARLEENRRAAASREAAVQSATQKRQEINRQRLAEDAHRRQQAEKARQAEDERRLALRQARQAEMDQAARAEQQRLAQLQALRSEVQARRNPLQDPLAENALSGELPWLRATGNRLATILGDAVVLRGVNLLGLESAAPDPQHGFAAGAGITPGVIDSILAFGANVIRLAINRARVLDGGAGFSAGDYLADLDWIIQRAAQGGAYTLLSLRRLDETSTYGAQAGLDGKSQPSPVAPMPDFERFEMWRVLAARYALEPAVLYDLFTAPHAPFPGDKSGIPSSWDLWTLWVQMSVADIRRLNPGALCFVSGMAGGTDLSGLPIPGTAGLPIPNLIYTAQVYPRRANPIPALQQVAKSFPAFVGEWGGLPLDAGWGQRTTQVLRAGGISWAAAHWNSIPSLTRLEREQILPTPFGRLVQRALAEVGEPLALSQPADATALPIFIDLP